MAASYKKLRVLGSGSFGKVYLAKEKYTNNKYVLKEIVIKSLPEIERNQSLTEVEILAKCKHLNVIKYRTAFVDCQAGVMGIVMEYALQGDLQDAIARQQETFFDEKVIMDWFTQICFGLKYIHSLNIMHRDLKTQNIFLADDNIIKIGDFGISRILAATSDCASTMIGTPFYLSPEICRQQPYNSKSDMWAAGCVLYNLCALTHPFDAPDLSQLVPKILHGHYNPLPSQYSQLVVDLVHVLLRQDPQQRPSAAQVLCIRAIEPYVDAFVGRSTQIRDRVQTPMPAAQKSVSATPNVTSSARSQSTITPKPSSSVHTNKSHQPDREEKSGCVDSLRFQPLQDAITEQRKPKPRTKTSVDTPKIGTDSHGIRIKTTNSKQDKENINPSFKTPEVKTQLDSQRIYTDIAVQAQKRAGLQSVDKNVYSAGPPVKKIRAIKQASPKLSLFRAALNKKEKDDFRYFKSPSTEERRKKTVNLRGGITYVVNKSSLSSSPASTSSANGNLEDKSNEMIGTQSVTSSTSDVHYDVCKYLWQAALKTTDDNIATQETIRAFLEGRLGSVSVREISEQMKTEYLAGTDFEEISGKYQNNISQYFPLFIKLIELEQT